ncbi:glycosyltransferase family 4 protein [Methylophilaceae bacterium]|nr:glycosyltransferase family 4 protein [Methylophilaceae bacterium]|tara:strand:- start:789 stop:1823 length:1035 start_codon:yes stop_codon:yes gene_type:complete
MKILQIMGGAGEGGAEEFFIDAVEALKNKKINQFLIINKKNQKRVKKISGLKILFATASFSKLIKWPTQRVIDKAINEFKPDIIHYWMGRASSFLVEGKHINIGWHSGYRGVERFRKCDYHIALTNKLKKHIANQGINLKDIYELPIYTKKNKLNKIDRSKFNTPKNKPLLLSLSRLHPVKGINNLIDAMLKIPDAYLWIAGSGPLETELKLQTTSLGLDDRIRFLGWREDKEILMATADICVFPSRNDSFGAVIIESWAARKTTVACKAPGPLGLIAHRKDGILVEIDNPEKFSKSVNEIINNKKLVKKLATNGYNKFQKFYTEKIFVRNILAIYTKILKINE